MKAVLMAALCAVWACAGAAGAEAAADPAFRCDHSAVADVLARCVDTCGVRYDLVDLEASSCVQGRRDECVCKQSACVADTTGFAAKCFSTCKSQGSMIDVSKSTCVEADADTGCVCLPVRCAAGDRDFEVCQLECAKTDRYDSVVGADTVLQVDETRSVCDARVEEGATFPAAAKCACAIPICGLFEDELRECSESCAAAGRTVDLAASSCVNGDIDACVCQLPSCLGEGAAVQARRVACAASCSAEGKVADWSSSDCGAANQCVCKVPCKPVIENLHYVPAHGIVSTKCDPDAGDDCANPTVRDPYGNDLWVRHAADASFNLDSVHMTEQICEPVAAAP